ncbi:hypothetical protein PN498_00930 [Oscillatoria sp. CS-180]|uniref:hypothetical protein n=1 Tax=Oscillatoria sp. CS-180 TaxID=3021720 RepID=UPI00232C8D29|nr:hypothetical protein [Oscillatoria sp. CS-180]MDB9524537.1 hypothetical protein [Oscillatoria sp. CS-180]
MESELEQLLHQAQRVTDRSDRTEVISSLTAKLMRSQSLGRPFKDEPKNAVYRDLRDRIKASLREAITKAIGQYQGDRDTVQTWSREVQAAALHTALDDDQLKQLALEAQRHLFRSPQRQHALTQLIEAIRQSGRLAHPHRSKFSPAFYDLLYDEALNQTLVYVCRKIDNYDPERGTAQKFMNWVNFRLDRQIIECRRDFNEQDAQELPNLNDLDTIAAPAPASTSLADEVKDYIATDPEGVFEATHIRHHPKASFQAIALARFAERSWEDIAHEFAIKVPTLSSFFQRCCEKFAPQFQRLL